MSLHYLGIAHFPILHRQFSSPTTSFPLGSSPSQDLMQDNKDVLIERLNDLVLRLSKDSCLEDSAVTAIHAKVDQIELLIPGERSLPGLKQVGDKSNATARLSRDNEEDIFWQSPTPTRTASMRLPETRKNIHSQSIPQVSETSTTRVAEIATAAEAIASQLTAAVLELQTRKEELDHIHDLLIIRAEKAAQRIIVLEKHVTELEEDFEANQSELKFLRIRLRALEVQCLQYVPLNEDQELSESIKNWRIDWEDIDRRTKARRIKCHASITVLDDTPTVVDGS